MITLLLFIPHRGLSALFVELLDQYGVSPGVSSEYFTVYLFVSFLPSLIYALSISMGFTLYTVGKNPEKLEKSRGTKKRYGGFSGVNAGLALVVTAVALSGRIFAQPQAVRSVVRILALPHYLITDIVLSICLPRAFPFGDLLYTTTLLVLTFPVSLLYAKLILWVKRRVIRGGATRQRYATYAVFGVLILPAAIFMLNWGAVSLSPERCPVHETAMRWRRRRVHYGRPGSFTITKRRAFPHAGIVRGGCVVGPHSERKRWVWVCAECEKELERWDRQAGTKCIRNLMFIGRALKNYAERNDGEMPVGDTAGEVFSALNVLESMLRCPGYPQEGVDRDDPEGVGYYIDPDMPAQRHDKRIVAADRPPWELNHGGVGVNVLFEDGEVKLIRPGDNGPPDKISNPYIEEDTDIYADTGDPYKHAWIRWEREPKGK